MHRAQHASLLDDPFFAIELDQIDLPVDEGLVAAVKAQEAARERFAQQLGPAVDNELVDDEVVGNEGSPAGAIALRLAGFLVMMTVGGAAAALVFADRVALLLGK